MQNWRPISRVSSTYLVKETREEAHYWLPHNVLWSHNAHLGDALGKKDLVLENLISSILLDEYQARI